MLMRLSLASMVFLFALFAVYPAAAQQADKSDTGSELFHACQATIRIMDSPSQSEPNTAISDYCIGYFEGFSDLSQFTETSLCLTNARVGTVIRVYVAYMEKHPKLLDDFKVSGVIYALKETYPCPVKADAPPK